MSRIRLLPIVLPILPWLALFTGFQPEAVACQPIARIASKGATRPRGTTVCAHERIALNTGITSVKLTCLKDQKQIDYKAGSALMACAGQKSIQLMRCSTDRQMICVEPKGKAKRLRLTDQTATHLSWLPTPNATHYKIKLVGYDFVWNGELSEPNLNYQEIIGLSAGNAYIVTISAYQGEVQLSTVDIALNVPSDFIANSQPK